MRRDINLVLLFRLLMLLGAFLLERLTLLLGHVLTRRLVRHGYSLVGSLAGSAPLTLRPFNGRVASSTRATGDKCCSALRHPLQKSVTVDQLVLQYQPEMSR